MKTAADINNRDALEPRSHFIKHFTEVMNYLRPPSVEAFGVGGSFGKQACADSYSDVDLFLLVNESNFTEFIQSINSFISLFGRCLLSRGPILVPNYGYSFSVLYEPFICCQFNINSRESLTPGPIRKHTKILFDDTGFYSAFTEQQADSHFDAKTVFHSSCTLFWFRVINVWRDLGRGHYWFAIRHLVDVRQQMFVLLRLKHSNHPADFAFVEKSLEQELGSEISSSFAPSLVDYSEESITAALKFSVDWFSREAPAYAASINAHYPSEAADHIILEIACEE